MISAHTPPYPHFEVPPPAGLAITDFSTFTTWMRRQANRWADWADNVVNVSGGADSAATYLLALESGIPFRAVMADTGNELRQTLEFAERLGERTGGPAVEIVKADFSAGFARKRAFIAAKWPADLVAGKSGRWVCRVPKSEAPAPPPDPADVYAPAPDIGPWAWKPGRPPISSEDAAARVALALDTLHPTGIPFLDMCMLKGRFPSQGARFCTEETKVLPMWHQVFLPMIQAGRRVVSWQGVRADESKDRGKLPPHSAQGRGYWIWRPLLRWTKADVFAMHHRHGLSPNPLYRAGMGRVGCGPCFGCRKAELAELANRFPSELLRIQDWEWKVAACSKRGLASFFAADKIPGRHQKDPRLPMPGIMEVVEWAKTGRDGWTLDLFKMPDEGSVSGCMSLYGLCE